MKGKQFWCILKENEKESNFHLNVNIVTEMLINWLVTDAVSWGSVSHLLRFIMSLGQYVHISSPWPAKCEPVARPRCVLHVPKVLRAGGSCVHIPNCALYMVPTYTTSALVPSNLHQKEPFLCIKPWKPHAPIKYALFYPDGNGCSTFRGWNKNHDRSSNLPPILSPCESSPLEVLPQDGGADMCLLLVLRTGIRVKEHW